ncbi:MAG: hypothetical protein KIT84_38495 [Labilithrix sp.]|nr:hypothetical protein [Labilithrix sp.]MCW5816951.1 hypothetical protein [Labilithrix sp.]
MGNRRHHKKLRAEVRARMARTGESYQQALARVLEGRTAGAVDLLRIEYFGAPATLATFEVAGRLACVVVSSRHAPRPFPESPIYALRSLDPHAVH